MTYTDYDPPNGSGGYGSDGYGGQRGFTPPRWLSRGEDWLDERGKGAWIALMVLGFIFFWPVGLALLAYMIWSKRMFRGSCGHHGGEASRERNLKRHARRHGFSTSGNSAFDSYKADTLRRLEEEQEAFEAFLERLRAAKDKSEFDQFMEDRAARAKAERNLPDTPPEAPPEAPAG